MKKKISYNNLDIYEIYEFPREVEATVCFDNDRFVFKGVFTVDRTKSSWKFWDQLQFVLHGKIPVIKEKRARNDGWNRIEIALPLQDMIPEIQELLLKGEVIP